MPANHIARSHPSRGRQTALKARSDFEAWQNQPTGRGLLLLTRRSGAVDGAPAQPRSLVIPLFSDTDLDGLIDVLSDPAEGAD